MQSCAAFVIASERKVKSEACSPVGLYMFFLYNFPSPSLSAGSSRLECTLLLARSLGVLFTANLLTVSHPGCFMACARIKDP